jgi:carbonic anhydrase/acetyltransferase-like protein (isoleucine patch superfamily)
MIYSLGERRIETVGDEYFVAPSADVIGSVRLGRWASVWFGSVLRGDTDWIEVGDGTNIQDGCVVHVDAGEPTTIGRNVVVGHQVMLHSCTIGDECLIGNGAIVMDRAVIGSHTLVAAGSFIAPGKTIPSGVVVMGSPARIVREMSDKDREMIRHGAAGYQANAQRFRKELKAVG